MPGGARTETTVTISPMPPHDETRIVELQPSDQDFQSVSVPLARASTIAFDNVEAFLSRHERFYDGYTYALYGHPASRELERKIANLENGTHALVVQSGLAALTLVYLTTLAPGDHVLVPESVYGPSRDICIELLSRLNISATFYDPLIGAGIGSLLRPETKLLWVESPGSLTMEVQDLVSIAATARTQGCLVAADNSWASPLFCKPLDLGADFAIEALSKHAGGHGDLVLGSVAVKDESLFRKLKDMARLLGYGASPDDCWLALRGLATLSVRLKHQSASAQRIATWLRDQTAVKCVLYPALHGDAGHDLWQRQFTGASGVFSIALRLAPREKVHRFVESLRLFTIGASFGCHCSLIAPAHVTARRFAGPWSEEDTLIRFSIGLEHCDDLLADLEQAMNRLS
jgi:cystathionine beta-lyase